MVETVEILDGRLGQRSVERVRYVINNLLHLVIVEYGDISLVLCISTRLQLVTILSLLVKYLVIFHADRCNKSYYHAKSRLNTPVWGSLRSPNYYKNISNLFHLATNFGNKRQSCLNSKHVFYNTTLDCSNNWLIVLFKKTCN